MKCCYFRSSARWLCVIGLLSMPFQAGAYTLYKDGASHVDFNVEIGLGIFNSQKSYAQARSTKDSPTWEEGYAKYGFSAAHPLGSYGSLYGTLNILSSATRGDGDAAGFTTGDEDQTDIEDAFLGWRSGDSFPWLGHDGIDLSFGSQMFVVGDGFLINGDEVDLGRGFDKVAKTQGISPGTISRGGAYWLAARKAFNKTAILKVGQDTGLSGDAFWLKSGNAYQADTSLAGVNVEYNSASYGGIGATYLRGLSVDKTLARFFGMLQRDGQDTVAVRAHGSLGLPGLSLSGEYVHEDNGQFGNDHAWYAEAGWTFSHLPWTPKIDYRYSKFSNGFDPLFYGFSRGYGTWYQGEVAANYSGPFSTDTEITLVELTAAPLSNVQIGVEVFTFRDTANDRLNANEVDLFAWWEINSHVTLSPLVGVFNPKYSAAQGGTQFGDAHANVLTQMIAIITF